MSDKEREAVRKAGAEDARRSRVEHGLPERIEDPGSRRGAGRDPPGHSRGHGTEGKHRTPWKEASGIAATRAAETFTRNRLRRSVIAPAKPARHGPTA
jgi:hypothetical protein